ncbi:MAG TPA: fibronectin type III domain-containing protein, partial [Anaeromyxobacteraceae bacterium]|nr:fibronectin type III domain-containing protein [Anaeromyxobacteraceae bacterium]
NGDSASVTPVPPGANCANGGVEIQVGSGTPAYVCNGANGADGQSASVTPEPAGANCPNGGVKIQVGSQPPSYVCNGLNAPCAGVPTLSVTSFTMSSGMPYTATIAVDYAGTRSLTYSFMGEGGYYTQIGAGQFSFLPNVSGGPYTDYVMVSDGCQLAWGALAGIYTPPPDVTNLAAGYPGSDRIPLSWTNPTTSNFAQVEITWSGGGGPVYVPVTASPNNQAIITGLVPGTPYTFTVKAMDAHGSRSAGVQVTSTTASWKVVFVTSAVYAGASFGADPANADAACQSAASTGIAAVKLPPGTYHAFLSFPGVVDGKDRIVDAQYALPDGTIVAASEAALLSGTLQHGIDMDEMGWTWVGQPVWTGTAADGTAYGSDPTKYQCGNWAVSADKGTVGISGLTDLNWTQSGTAVCSFPYASLYCFQQ